MLRPALRLALRLALRPALRPAPTARALVAPEIISVEAA